MTRQAQTGLAMVIVIWVLSLLTIMAGSFALSMRRETVVITAVKEGAEALAFAEMGVIIAEQMLLAKGDKQWLTDGSIYQVKYRGADIRVRSLSEQGKIDINKASESILLSMMRSTSVEETARQEEVVAALLDWRDKDDNVHINGAEKEQYENAGLTYHPANKDFQAIEELQLVLGMETTLYQELEPLITVYSGQAEVNQQLASPEVMQAISNLELDESDESDELARRDERDEFLQQRDDDNEEQFDAEDPLTDDSEGYSLGNRSNSVYTVISQVLLNGETEVGIKVTIKKVALADQSFGFEVLGYQQLYQGPSFFSQEMEPFLILAEDESELEY